jgi:hypothetical protein
VSESGRVPGIEAVATAFWERRFAHATIVIRRGVERGELSPETDPEFFVETLIAPLFLRALVTVQPLTSGYADRVVDWALGTPAPASPGPASPGLLPRPGK